MGSRHGLLFLIIKFLWTSWRTGMVYIRITWTWTSWSMQDIQIVKEEAAWGTRKTWCEHCHKMVFWKKSRFWLKKYDLNMIYVNIYVNMIYININIKEYDLKIQNIWCFAIKEYIYKCSVELSGFWLPLKEKIITLDQVSSQWKKSGTGTDCY